jgi:hypothetical protein
MMYVVVIDVCALINNSYNNPTNAKMLKLYTYIFNTCICWFYYMNWYVLYSKNTAKKLYIAWNQNLNNLVKKQTGRESATMHALGLTSKNHSKHHCPRLSSQNSTHNSSFSNVTLQTFTVITTHFQIFVIVIVIVIYLRSIHPR